MIEESMAAVFSAVCLGVAVVFFWAGTMGMLRFPDVYTRLHAMTKADNLGVGLTVVALIPIAPGFSEVLKLVLVWGFTLLAATTAAHLVAGAARREGVEAREKQ